MLKISRIRPLAADLEGSKVGYSHYHQCIKCKHIWSCDGKKCFSQLNLKDDRCRYGFSTGYIDKPLVDSKAKSKVYTNLSKVVIANVTSTTLD